MSLGALVYMQLVYFEYAEVDFPFYYNKFLTIITGHYYNFILKYYILDDL